MTIMAEGQDAAAAEERGEPFGRASRASMLVGAVAVVLAVLSGFATFLILSGLTPIVPTHNVVVTCLFVNALLVLLLFVLISVEAFRLWRARRHGIAGARLHGRIVGLFAFVAVVPAVIVAIVASVTLDRGLDRWFSGRTREMIENSASVARAYVQDHARNIGIDQSVVASVLEQARSIYDTEKFRFDELVRVQAALRDISGAYVIRDDLSIITRVVERAGDKFLVPPERAMERARNGEVVILTPGLGDTAEQVAALSRLKGYDDVYLYLVRRLDPKVMDHLRKTEIAAVEYGELERRRLGVQIAFGLMYIGVAFILLLSAVWIGFWFANRLVSPIRRLIAAARLVSDGNLEVMVPVRPSEGDLANLGQTFNNMTSQLREQRAELVDANVKLDTRRRFTEAVLAGVTAGVVGLDERGRVDLVNRSAEAILELGAGELVGRPLAEAVPELADFLDTAIRRGQRLAGGQIELKRHGHERNVTVRVTTEEAGAAGRGYVVTLDDITELVSAQRTSAWADVARRIAHEIKNPLTPIQLSAERLKRKYGKVIRDDREVFEQCTDTIIRQVGDIGRMVDEFSSFARMPKAVMGNEDLVTVVRDSVFLTSVSRPDIKVTLNLPDGPVPCVCDRRLISQAITNLVKNATEAIAAVGDEKEAPWIAVDLETDGGMARITVTDNGCGLPAANRQRLLEPYMTTREKGTGLGLAIVRKIVEDHGGTIRLADAPQVAEGGHGTRIILDFPLNAEPASDEARAEGDNGKSGAGKADERLAPAGE